MNRDFFHEGKPETRFLIANPAAGKEVEKR